MAGHGQVGVDLDAPAAVGARPGGARERVGERDRVHAGRPDDRPGVDPLGGSADLDRDAARVDRGGARALAHGHAELGELLADLARELLAERGDHALAGVEEDHPRVAGVDPPEVALHRARR